MTYWKLKSFFTPPADSGREKKAQKKHTSITTDVNTKQYKRSYSIYTATTAKYDRRDISPDGDIPSEKKVKRRLFLKKKGKERRAHEGCLGSRRRRRT